MRQLIAAFKVSLDGKIEGSAGYAEWVDGWSEDYRLTSQVDTCLLGGKMYPGYEQYWSAIQRNEPGAPLPMTGKAPTPAEGEWARFAARTPHYVLSTTLTSAVWPNTSFLRTLEDVAALKQGTGKDIYLMGGARLAASLLDAGLLDEVRLIVYPLIVGHGKALFETVAGKRNLVLRHSEQLEGGRLSMNYAVVA